MEIVIKNENTAVAKYNLNYNEVKNFLAQELKKYDKLVVTEEFMSSAKKSRAELNAMKKDLKDRLSEIRKIQLKPYEDLKTNYTDELEKMIDEYVVKIDKAIKEIEKKKAEEKNLQIKEYFDEMNKKSNLEISLNQVFNPKWTNATYSMNRVKCDIDKFFSMVTEDLKIIECFDDEFVIPLRKLYLSCFDMSAVMRNKVEFDNEKKKRLEAEAEAERLRKELELAEQKQKEKEDELRRMAETNTAGTDTNSTEADGELAEIPIEEGNGYIQYAGENCENGTNNGNNENENNTEAVEDDLTSSNLIPEENIPEDTETPQENAQNNPEKEYIEFWVEVTPEQKLLFRNLVLDNNIPCGKIKKRKTEKEIVEILKHSFGNVYCDTCDNDGKNEICENCHRKSMMWAISENTAKNIAKEIL